MADMRLPEFGAKRNEAGEIVIFRRGAEGFWSGDRLTLEDDDDIAAFNERMGATPGALEAMEFGSMFGWHLPGAQLEAGEDMAARKAARKAG